MDVALFLLGPQEPGLARGLIARVCGALGRDDVDVVFLDNASLTLFSRAEGLRVEVEAAIMARYLDRVPRMRRYLDLAARRLAERGFG